MQLRSFPTVIHVSALDDMGQKETNAKIERLTARVTAIENRNPTDSSAVKGWDRNFVIAIVALVVSVVALPIMLASWIEPHLQNDLKNDVKIEVAEQLKEPLKELHDISTDIADIKGQLKILAPIIENQISKNLKSAKNIPTDQLKSAIEIAHKQQIKIDTQDLAQAGQELISRLPKERSAWDAAIDFLNYKSFLDATLTIKYRQVGIPGEKVNTMYQATSPPGTAASTFSVLGVVPPDEAAKFIKIGAVDTNTRGNDWIIVDGGGLALDGMRLKKVILRNVYIVYDGGPLELQDVYFLNCTFSVTRQPNGQALAVAVLKSPISTSFTSS